jgi:predicted permease
MGARTRQVVLVAQVALCFVLLTGAVLVIQSLARLLNQDRELPSSVLTAELTLSPAKYPTIPLRAAFASEVLAGIRRTPGVSAAGLVSNLPLGGGAEVTLPVRISGSTDPAAESQNIGVDRELVSPGYFQTMGLALVRGRDFGEQDGPDAASVAIISEEMANRYWRASDPLGATVSMFGDPHPRTIVGVVRTIRSFSLKQKPVPQVYFPYAQQPSAYFGVVVSTTSDARSVIASVRAAVRAVDNTVPVFRIRTFGQVRLDSVAPQRDRAIILGVFGVLAIALAAIGIFGAASYNVALRGPEIGIRRALGAPSASVVRFVLRESLVPVTAGLAVGVLASLAVNRLLASVLFGIGPDDPTTLAIVGVGLLFVALIATAVPAARAIQIDPMDAIRFE